MFELFPVRTYFLFVAKLRELDWSTVVSDHAHNLSRIFGNHFCVGSFVSLGVSPARPGKNEQFGIRHSFSIPVGISGRFRRRHL